MKYCMIFCAASSKQEGKKIADILLKARLASCVQFIPMTSRYWWQGTIEHTDEIQLCIKTREDLYEQIQEKIKENHSYKVPEIIKIQIDTGLPDYLKWISNETC